MNTAAITPAIVTTGIPATSTAAVDPSYASRLINGNRAPMTATARNALPIPIRPERIVTRPVNAKRPTEIKPIAAVVRIAHVGEAYRGDTSLSFAGTTPSSDHANIARDV